jgi:hypothetical protein
MTAGRKVEQVMARWGDEEELRYSLLVGLLLKAQSL